MNDPKELIVIDDDKSEITVPHWGITLRSLFGAALSSQPNPSPGEQRQYAVRLKGAHIATLNVRQHLDLTN